jgi:putative membrane protein
MAIKAKGRVKPLLHALGLMSTLTLVRHRRMVARWIGQSAWAQGLVEPPKSRTTVEMSTKLKEFLQRWLITTVAVLVATQVVKRIHYDNWQGLLAATLLLGFLNAFIRPVLMFLSLPLVLVTFGFFVLVINAVLLYLVGRMKSFHVDTFGAAFWGALLISIVSLILNSLTGTGTKIQVRRGKKAPPGPPDDHPSIGSGPVIDV